MSPLWFWDGPEAVMPPTADALVLPPGEWELVRSLHRILRNASAPAYASPMGPFPVDPADVPPEAVRAVRRTLLRHEPGDDDELARLLVAVVIAALAPGGLDSAPGGAVLAAGSLGDPEVAVSAAAGATVPAAAGNDPGGSRPATDLQI